MWLFGKCCHSQYAGISLQIYCRCCFTCFESYKNLGNRKRGISSLTFSYRFGKAPLKSGDGVPPVNRPGRADDSYRAGLLGGGVVITRPKTCLRAVFLCLLHSLGGCPRIAIFFKIKECPKKLPQAPSILIPN
jgi:hypothetical protein